MKLTVKICAFFLAAVLLFGCDKYESTNPLSIAKVNYNYFPITVGTYVEYDVNKIDVDIEVGKKDTSFYHIREVIDATFIDNEGRETLKIKRYRKNTGKTEWLIKDVWTANRTTTNSQRVEENVRYMNLIFPVEKNESWNRNVFNSLGEVMVSYTLVDVPETIGLLSYDSVLTVTKNVDPPNLLGSSSRVEKHASGVGMVYLKDLEIIKKSVSTETSVTYIDNIYRETIMTATAFGKEK